MPGESENNSPSGASPSDPAWLPPSDVPFWRPPLVDAFKGFGLRWLFLPLVLLPGIGSGIIINIHSHSSWAYVVSLGVCLGMSVPIAAAFATKKFLREIPGPFCIHCGRSLKGLADNGNCPECGRPYSFRLIEEYRRDPGEFIDRCRSNRSISHV